jgi:hypothetical protein
VPRPQLPYNNIRSASYSKKRQVHSTARESRRAEFDASILSFVRDDFGEGFTLAGLQEFETKPGGDKC